MFVEGEVEVKIKDRSTQILDEHDLKLWLQRSFKNMSCYRMTNFRKDADKTLRAIVAIKITDLPPTEQAELKRRANDIPLLRSFIENMFEGKGSCRCISDAKLREQ